MTNVAFITNLGGPQGLLILLAAVLMFGGKKLPELGRSLGESMREFAKGKRDEKEPVDRTKKP